MEPRLSSQNIQVQLCMLIHVYVKEANVIIADILVTYTLQENDSLSYSTYTSVLSYTVAPVLVKRGYKCLPECVHLFVRVKDKHSGLYTLFPCRLKYVNKGHQPRVNKMPTSGRDFCYNLLTDYFGIKGFEVLICCSFYCNEPSSDINVPIKQQNTADLVQ